MVWYLAMALGAVGGALTELLVLHSRIAAWRSARRGARERGEPLVPLARYTDPPADALAAASLVVLGAAAGLLFHNQVVGFAAAIAVGVSAPALLRQLGTSAGVREAVQGPPAAVVAESEVRP
ncbi:hypothetical protein [Streptomyces bohaiensis]|uniref:Uncharacterized protein n=1 Tax=Streptomyces bohaiensis TaxID=1431344 RepID=A0ABX1CHM1_9ACTN|nr:hypothetical protein [Streptomyces bohaiensis]NJQ16719.1 hypothetical protein [Streptomyces bohaiensis]